MIASFKDLVPADLRRAHQGARRIIAMGVTHADRILTIVETFSSFTENALDNCGIIL
jgi:hypothetical protein